MWESKYGPPSSFRLRMKRSVVLNTILWGGFAWEILFYSYHCCHSMRGFCRFLGLLLIIMPSSLHLKLVKWIYLFWIKYRLVKLVSVPFLEPSQSMQYCENRLTWKERELRGLLWEKIWEIRGSKVERCDVRDLIYMSGWIISKHTRDAGDWVCNSMLKGDNSEYSKLSDFSSSYIVCRNFHVVPGKKLFTIEPVPGTES